MPKGVNGYNEATATNFTEREQLPPGGYVIGIKDVREESYSWGDVIVLCFEIIEGEYKGFYKRQFDAMSDEFKKWKGTHRIIVPTPKSSSENDMKRFKRALGFYKSQIEAFGLNINAESDWDAKILRGKKVGALFANTEFYNKDKGESYWYTSCDRLVPAQDIRDGNFKVPKDKEDRKKPKDTFGSAPAPSGGMEDFEEITEGAMPF